MAPSTLPSTASNTTQETSRIIAIAVCLPLAALSLLVLWSIVYRRRVRTTLPSPGQGVLSVGVTVDVSKVVDDPCSRDTECYEHKNAFSVQEVELPEKSSPRLLDSWRAGLLEYEDDSFIPLGLSTSQSGQLCPRPVRREQRGHPSEILATPSLKTTPSFPLHTAFPYMDVNALSQSTIRFPRLPSVQNVNSSLLNYPTIPSLRTVSSSRPSIHEPDARHYATVNALDNNYQRVQEMTIPHGANDDLEGTTSDDSLSTLIDIATCPTIDSSEEPTFVVEENTSSSKLDRHLSCSASVHSSFQLEDSAAQLGVCSRVCLETSPSPGRLLSDTLDVSPLGFHLAPSFSPLVLTSLSPLHLPASPCPEPSLSPNLDDLLKARSPLVDEILPEPEQTMASPASFRPLSVSVPKEPRSRFPGKVLQPLFETLASRLHTHADLSHCSTVSLQSPFSFSQSRAPQTDMSRFSPTSSTPGARTQLASSSLSLVFDHLLEHSCDISSLRTVSECGTDVSTDMGMTETYSPTDSTGASAFNSHSSLMRLSLPSPTVSFKLSFSPSSSVGTSSTQSPGAFHGSPFERPRAPTPGSISSRFSMSLDRSVDISDISYEVVDNCVFTMQQTPGHQVPVSPLRLDIPTLSQRSNLSPRYLDVSDHRDPLDATSCTPRLLPPLNLGDISPLSL